MKHKHIAFWMIFPVVFAIFTVLTLFLFDLANGPLILFILALLVLAGFAISSILLLNQRKRYRLIPWVSSLVLLGILFVLARPSTERIPASLEKRQEKTEALTLRNGKVQGAYSKDKAVEIYAGIPYAKAPIGSLRWKEPVPIENWDGVKDCTYFAPRSMQDKSSAAMNTLVEMYAEKGWHPDYKMYPDESMSEDSLYLNIWRPSQIQEPLPILVYIHGGSLTSGSSAFADYNGETFARNNVIMVTVAYRLGVFGYFAHQDLASESPNHTTGNYGLLDQIEALKWVKENASYFGGDPDNITIAGESAGSSSVSAICASPLAANLFKRAIGESSSIVTYRPPHTFRTMEKALKMGEDIMEEMKCASIEELRKLPAETLQKTKYANSAMTVDGYALPKTPYEIYQEGHNNEEALLNGYNVKEADAFVVPTFLTSPTNKSNIRERLVAYFDEEAAGQFMDAYHDEIERDAFSAFNSIISAYWFMQPHLDWSNLAVSKGEDVYRYQFTKENGYYGTFHSGEMIYCYGNLDKSSHSFAYDESDYALEKTMVAYWTNFIKTGNPNGEGLPAWGKWAKESDPLQELGARIGPIQEEAGKAYPIIDNWKARAE